jgi:RNA polymerase sigma factor (sigma-70 family)
VPKSISYFMPDFATSRPPVGDYFAAGAENSAIAGEAGLLGPRPAREPFSSRRDYVIRAAIHAMSHSCQPDAPSRIADELLVVRCQLGESDAFDTLIELWHRPLWVYIRRMAGRDEDAQDILQDVWLRVIRGIPRLRDGSRLRGWLFGITRRALMDRLRKQYAAPAHDSLDGDDVSVQPDLIDREADLRALDAALEAMPLGEREVLTLFYLRDLSLNELAETLGIPVGTAKSRLFRARQMLRTRMERQEP